MHTIYFPISAEIVCEELQKDVCAFSIASSGKRCLLETSKAADGGVEYQCRTSEVVVERMAEYIETDQSKLCSPACYQKCPNIVDLYFNLAAGEGVFLPDLCQKQRTNPRRAMVELMSSGVAPGPVSDVSEDIKAALAPATPVTAFLGPFKFYSFRC
ncbi:hypothetical protein SESBI_03644 [Sesbania bispinosa]|nr:hypothetical protein SESBI_03644 [Sesbania bispinosa]